MKDFLKNLFSTLFSSPKTSPEDPGLLLDEPSVLAELPRHELFFGSEGAMPDWMSLHPSFRYQGSSYWCTAFAGTSIASTLERFESGKTVLFSPMELFYRSGGSPMGNYLVRTADCMKDSLVLEEDKPTPIPTRWDQAEWQKYKDVAKASPEAIEKGKTYAMKSFASVIPTKERLRAALIQSPLMLAIGIGRGYFMDIAPKQDSYSAYHAVVLLNIDYDGSYVIFDSLTQKQGFNGVHKLASDYEILSALSFVDLPDDWKDVQAAVVENTSVKALDHYGKKRDIALEQKAAADLSVASKKNPSVAAFIGREFLICVNAIAYGGYSVQDLLNHFTSVRRTGKPIFDLNQIRK